MNRFSSFAFLVRMQMMCLISLVSLLGMYGVTLAQGPTFDFAESFSSGTAETLCASARDASGNIIMTGYFQGTMDFDPGSGTQNLSSNNGSVDMFVAKYNASGEYVWAFRIGQKNSDAGINVGVDDNGNIYVTGKYDADGTGGVDVNPGSGTANLKKQGSFVAKYTSAGAFVWAFPLAYYHSNQNDPGLTVDGSGSVFVYGGDAGVHGVDFDPGSATKKLSGNSQGFIAKYNSSGTYQWVSSLVASTSPSGGIEVHSLAVDENGYFCITGRFHATVDLDPSSSTANRTSVTDTSGEPGHDIFLAKYSASNGAYQWGFGMGGLNGDAGESVAFDSDGSVVVVGGINTSCDFDPGSNDATINGNGMFMAKYSSSGIYAWSQLIPGVSSPGVHGCAIDASDNILLTASFKDTVDFDPGSGTAEHISVVLNTFDVAVVKYDASGSYVWSFSIGGESHDHPKDLLLTSDSKLYLTGTYLGTADFDPSSNTSSLSASGSASDFFLASYDLSEAAKRLIPRNTIASVTETALRVWPNPFVNEVHVGIDCNEGPISVEIFDLAGSMMERTETQGQNIEFSIGSTLPSGSYLVVVRQGEVALRSVIHKTR